MHFGTTEQIFGTAEQKNGTDEQTTGQLTDVALYCQTDKSNSMSIRKLLIEISAALFILLWVYAGVSKLLDYQTFSVQLGKSPLLSGFEKWITVIIPMSELLIAGMLLTKRFRLTGMYASLLMMVMFTAYIIAILNFSYHIPCSCGGILNSLGWTEHLVFNIIFVLLAIGSIVLMSGKGRQASQADSFPQPLKAN